MKSNMRGVAEARPDIAKIIEKCQPYRPGREWLGHLATLTNENKHQALTAQTRREVTQISPGAGGGAFGLTGGPQIHMSGGASIQMSGGASIGFSGPGQPFQQNMTRTILVDWLFEQPQVSALGLLKHVQQELPKLLDELLDAADL